MDTLVAAAPILEGQVSRFRSFSHELAQGSKHGRYVEFLRLSGLSRVRAWLHGAEPAAMGIILYEGNNPQGFLEQIATSKDPFAEWFRGKVIEIHGVDLSEPAIQPLEAVSDVRVT